MSSGAIRDLSLTGQLFSGGWGKRERETLSVTCVLMSTPFIEQLDFDTSELGGFLVRSMCKLYWVLQNPCKTSELSNFLIWKV